MDGWTQGAVTDETAAQILGGVASGLLLEEILVPQSPPKWPTPAMWLAQVAEDKELSDAWERALKLSAWAFSERSVKVAKDLSEAPGSPQKVSAFRVLIDQYKWLAGKRDQQFGEKAQGVVMVPFQINTTLDLGQRGAVGVRGVDQPAAKLLTAEEVYHVTFTPQSKVEGEGEDEPAPHPSLAPTPRATIPRVKIPKVKAKGPMDEEEARAINARREVAKVKRNQQDRDRMRKAAEEKKIHGE